MPCSRVPLCSILAVCLLGLHCAGAQLYDESEMNQENQIQMDNMDNGPKSLNLPSNATQIRKNLVDNFSCKNRTYGYYSDVDNECQVFHVCLPVVYADGKKGLFRYSFICPNTTYFDQGVFSCVPELDMMVTCQDAPMYYYLNDNFGQRIDDDNAAEGSGMMDSTAPSTMMMKRRRNKPNRKAASEKRAPKIEPEEFNVLEEE